MCILLKLDYAKFGVSNSFIFKSYRRKTFGGSDSPPPPPPLVKGELKYVLQVNFMNFSSHENFTDLP